MATYQERVSPNDAVAIHEASNRSNMISVEDSDADVLFTAEDRMRFNRRWTDVQSQFVDDPYQAVASADDLVADVIDWIRDRFAEHRSALAEQLTDDNEATTEDLRLAIRRYRAFFHRLLSS